MNGDGLFDPKTRDFHPSPLAQKFVPLDGAYTVRISGFQRVKRHTSRGTGRRSDGMVAGCVTSPKTRDFGRPQLAQTFVPLDGTYTVQIKRNRRVEWHTPRATGWGSDAMVTGQSACPGGRSKASPLAQTLVPSNGTYTIRISVLLRV